MSKAVMISIQPLHLKNIFPVKDILTGDFVSAKTIDVRKTAPTIDTPFKCYIYMTAIKLRCRFWEYITAYQNSKGEMLDGSQKVVGEFVCDRIDKYEYSQVDGVDIDDDTLLKTMLDREEINIYAHGKDLYGWHISDLVIYDKPKELGDFYVECKADYVKCHKCADFEQGTCFFYKGKSIKRLTRPTQSWCYVEGEVK